MLALPACFCACERRSENTGPDNLSTALGAPPCLPLGAAPWLPHTPQRAGGGNRTMGRPDGVVPVVAPGSTRTGGTFTGGDFCRFSPANPEGSASTSGSPSVYA